MSERGTRNRGRRWRRGGRGRRWLRKARRVFRRRPVKILALGCLAGLIGALAGPAIWLRGVSGGHIGDFTDSPTAETVIVFGAQLTPGGTRPKPFLAGRLRTTADLVHAGKARKILVSGDGQSAAGSETDVMLAYLTELGVDRARIVVDPFGMDTYDTCRRAHDVYGVRRALLVTQAYHLPRAVGLCRTLGVDADGVEASCRDCREATLTRGWLRELPAGTKAVLDTVRDRPPAVVSPPDPALTRVRTG